MRFTVIQALVHPQSDKIIGYPFVYHPDSLKSALSRATATPLGGEWGKWSAWTVGWGPNSEPYLVARIPVEYPLVNVGTSMAEPYHKVIVMPEFPITPYSLARLQHIFNNYNTQTGKVEALCPV